MAQLTTTGEYLVRFSQVHETFRLAEIQALAVLENLDLRIISYDPECPYCIVSLPSPAAAASLVRRSILAQSVHELWGSGTTLEDLHASVKSKTSHLWPAYATPSFKFSFDTFNARRMSTSQHAIIESFSYLPFHGPILMTSPDAEFTVFERWAPFAQQRGITEPEHRYLGRWLGGSSRELAAKLDLKKRAYISTTSMDAELALVTANVALAGPGKLFYDPFVGTGSFPVAAAQMGAMCWGSDIDGRSVRGDEGKGLGANFEQYGLLACMGDMFTSDLTNSPIRRVPLRARRERVTNGHVNGGERRAIFDGIICDPPYGVREGLRVLGVRNPEKRTWVREKGMQMYKEESFVPPKKPYSFLAMLNDILVFSAEALVDNGRLAFWMPTGNDEAVEIPVPTHPSMEVVAVCTQAFYKWSRRLMIYRRLPDSEIDQEALTAAIAAGSHKGVGTTADELNPFRRGYFTGFATPTPLLPESEKPPG